LTFRERLEADRHVERSFAFYRQMVETFVHEEAVRPDILDRARTVTQRLAAKAGQNFEDFRYRSICRLNFLQKPETISKNR